MSAILIYTERGRVQTMRIPHLVQAPLLTKTRAYPGVHTLLEIEIAALQRGVGIDEHPADIGTPIYDALAWKYDARPAWDAS